MLGYNNLEGDLDDDDDRQQQQPQLPPQTYAAYGTSIPGLNQGGGGTAGGGSSNQLDFKRRKERVFDGIMEMIDIENETCQSKGFISSFV